MAAAMGSSIRKASFVPISTAASRTALRSTSVAPEGTHIIALRLMSLPKPLMTFFRKCLSMASVMV